MLTSVRKSDGFCEWFPLNVPSDKDAFGHQDHSTFKWMK